MKLSVKRPALPLRTVDLLWTTPNILTLARVAVVPVIVYLLTDPGRIAGLTAAVLFFAAALTDYFDGHLARKRGTVTTLGKFLDPLADKLVVVSGLIMLAAMPCEHGASEIACGPRVPAWVVVVIVGRELAVTGLRSIAASEGITLGAEELGKYKTVFQVFALVGLSIHYRYLYVDFHVGGMYFLWLSLLLGLWSAVDYHLRVYRQVRVGRKREDEVDSPSSAS